MGGEGGMGRQAWGRIAESLDSRRLRRGEMQTQEQGSRRQRKEKEVVKGYPRLFLINSSPNGEVSDLPHPSQA